MTTEFIYPTPRQFEALALWSSRGPQALSEPVSTAARARDFERHKNLSHLRRLVKALDLDPEFDGMLTAVRRRDISQLDPRVFAEIFRVARYHGYITRDMRAVPLTGRQLHVIRMLCWGHTLTEVNTEFRLNHCNSLREIMARARERHGCATTAQLIATCYRNGWFPQNDELRKLLAEQHPRTMPKGYRSV